MRILHYFLGFPPYRTGGLTKYSLDLMQAQAKQNNTVFALWPGQISMWKKKVNVKVKNDVNGIISYELVNPLPVSLDEGITAFDEYMKSCNSNVYSKFLKTIKPDVIHIHTLMGLHKEFVYAANDLGIRTIFTTHDYFGLCPKVTLYRFGNVCENDQGCLNCIQCNISALSLDKIKLMQSPLYRILKNSYLVKEIRRRHRNTFHSREDFPEMSFTEVERLKLADEYKKLRKYYINMLLNMDIIHFNSTVTEAIYKRYFTPKDSRVISIMHSNIADNRNNKRKESTKLRLTCLAPAKPFKGFNVIKFALDDLWESGKRDFELKVYSSVEKESPYMKVQEDGYQYSELAQIFAETDVLLAPSIWYETFGFTVLEAISYGIPVIVSNHVGAKDIVGKGGIIVEAGSICSFKKAVLSLTKERVCELRSFARILTIKSWESFLDENYTMYRG